MPDRNSQIFRDVSLERLSSPEQLDQMLQVTTPRSWVALVGVGIILGAAIVWGFFGVIPEKVGGSGVLINTGGVVDVTSPASGRVIDVSVRAGESVEAGQTVARISQPELDDQLKEATATLETLREKKPHDMAFRNKETQLRVDALKKKKRLVEKNISNLKEDEQWLEEKLEARRGLLEDGLVTKQQIIDTEQRLRSVRQKIETARSDLDQIEIDLADVRNRQQEAARSHALDIQQQKRRIEELRDRIQRTSRVVSDYRGTVLELAAERGEVVRAGQSILNLDQVGPSASYLEAVLYIPPKEGKRIETGMRVQISPSTVEAEEFGHLVAEVKYVSDYPKTENAMMGLLENPKLVRELSKKGAPYEVRAELLPDTDTYSQYRWTSSEGPQIKIQSGTLCESTVAVNRKRPIAMVLPMLRRELGLN